MKSFTVSSKDVFDKKKNPNLSLSVTDIMNNDKIEKNFQGSILTEEQKKEYLKDSGKCPFCESRDIYGGEWKSDSMSAWQKIECNKCNKSWFDIYKLIDVEAYE